MADNFLTGVPAEGAWALMSATDKGAGRLAINTATTANSFLHVADASGRRVRIATQLTGNLQVLCVKPS